ncbi:hypothetical protein CHMI_01092 [Cellulomonas hominis]|nr:hypothetical protein CHMI_01092 [Cellulomonas hominis]
MVHGRSSVHSPCPRVVLYGTAPGPESSPPRVRRGVSRGTRAGGRVDRLASDSGRQRSPPRHGDASGPGSAHAPDPQHELPNQCPHRTPARLSAGRRPPNAGHQARSVLTRGLTAAQRRSGFRGAAVSRGTGPLRGCAAARRAPCRTGAAATRWPLKAPHASQRAGDTSLRRSAASSALRTRRVSRGTRRPVRDHVAGGRVQSPLQVRPHVPAAYAAARRSAVWSRRASRGSLHDYAPVAAPSDQPALARSGPQMHGYRSAGGLRARRPPRGASLGRAVLVDAGAGACRLGRCNGRFGPTDPGVCTPPGMPQRAEAPHLTCAARGDPPALSSRLVGPRRGTVAAQWDRLSVVQFPRRRRAASRGAGRDAA